MQFGYPKLLHWACSGDLGAFYASLRWDGWQGEVETLSPDDGLHLYPPPWTAEGKDVGNVSRRPVPMDELWSWVNDARRQLG